MSRLPAALGLCKSDVLQIANYVNAAQSNLLMAKEAGDEGWLGTWTEVAFSVSQTTPYLTTPRDIARLEAAAVCQFPVPIYNQFYEYLNFGNGRMPKTFKTCRPFQVEVFERNFVPLFVDPPTSPSFIQVYPTDPADAGKRVLFQGTDQNSKPIYSQDGLNPTNGIYATLQPPFVNVGTQMNSITGIQKDQTVGQVQIFSMNPTTGEQTLLLTMEPSETTASYRRYYFNNLPVTCCPGVNSPAGQVTVTTIAKLDLIPVQVDTDYCLIQNLEALINECQAIRYRDMDTAEAKGLAGGHHKTAIQNLNGQLIHYLGAQQPAVSFKPFGSARLANKRIGSLV